MRRATHKPSSTTDPRDASSENTQLPHRRRRLCENLLVYRNSRVARSNPMNPSSSYFFHGAKLLPGSFWYDLRLYSWLATLKSHHRSRTKQDLHLRSLHFERNFLKLRSGAGVFHPMTQMMYGNTKRYNVNTYVEICATNDRNVTPTPPRHRV